MPAKSTSDPLEGVTEGVERRRDEPEGNNIDAVIKDADGQTTISKVIRVTAEDFKTPCRGG